MEAFYGRGNNNYQMRHDLEDFIAVIEGRKQLLRELAEAPTDLREYLREATGQLLENERFLDALPGYVPGDAISQRRISIIIEQLKNMANL